MNEALKNYIEQEILPRYDHFDAAHRRDHAEQVMRESVRLAAQHGARESKATVAVSRIQ